MSNLNVSLTDELVSFVKTKVASGRYTSSSEVVREALRIMERHEQTESERLRLLQQAWRDGIESGDFRPLDMEAVKAEGRKRLMAQD
jgi:antitoxin ParD1/3/4